MEQNSVPGYDKQILWLAAELTWLEILASQAKEKQAGYITFIV